MGKERLESRHFEVRGRVQGVGFRYFTQLEARRIGVSGWVRNCADGSVESAARGTRAQLDAFEEALRTGPALARVESVGVSEAKVEGESRGSFEIVH